MIRFACPHCGAKLQVAEAHAGKRGRCPQCRGPTIVPPAPERTPEPALELVREDPPGAAPVPSELLEHLAVHPPPLPLSQAPDARASRLTQRLYDSIAGATGGEPTGERRLPWPLDILLYPFSFGGLTTLAIVIGISFLSEILPLGLLGWLVRVVIGLYGVWYLAECVHDSAKGGTRAPMALDTADLGDMRDRALYLAGVYCLFVAPAGIYWLWTSSADPIFWALVAWAVLFFPMGLLAMVIHDSTSALNPLFLLGAIVRTLVPYLGLLLLFGILAGLHRLLAHRLMGGGAFLRLLEGSFSIYLSFVMAHVLGRFYWRCRERLDWGI
ncbi:MAG: hypothetical protein FJ280_03405 [Planctomycetes bacterium]|nr:hypothetical protein [Planctomycetota bacterium]